MRMIQTQLPPAVVPQIVDILDTSDTDRQFDSILALVQTAVNNARAAGSSQFIIFNSTYVDTLPDGSLSSLRTWWKKIGGEAGHNKAKNELLEKHLGIFRQQAREWVAKSGDSIIDFTTGGEVWRPGNEVSDAVMDYIWQSFLRGTLVVGRQAGKDCKNLLQHLKAERDALEEEKHKLELSEEVFLSLVALASKCERLIAEMALPEEKFIFKRKSINLFSLRVDVSLALVP